MKWITLNEIPLFKKLGLSFKTSTEKFKKPKRIPSAQQKTEVNPEINLKEMQSHYLEDYISVFQSQIDKLLENNLALVDENIAFKVKNSETKADYEMLKFQNQLEVQKLNNECESLRKDLSDHVEMVSDQREELRKLRVEYQTKLEDQHEQLTKLFSIQSDLMEKNNRLSEQYTIKNNALEEVQVEFEAAKKEARDLKKTLEGSLADRENELLNQVKSWKHKYKTDFTALKLKYEGELKALRSQLESEISLLTQKHESELKAEQTKSSEQLESIMKTHQEQIKEMDVKLELQSHKLKKSPTSDDSKWKALVEEKEKALQAKDLALKEKDQKIQELLGRQREFASKYKQDFTKAQKTFESYQNVIHKQKQKEQDLSSNVIQLNQNLKKVQDDLELERSKAHRLELLMNQQEALHEIADEKIKVQDEFVAFKELGKLFEISNAQHWEIRADIYQGTRFTLKQMREMIDQGEIDEESFVRREGKWWKKAKEVHELFLELREREENGEILYYIERQSLRVPCGDKVEVVTDKAEFEGVCINISTGGCLIQVLDMNTYAFKKGDEITIAFVSESLLFEFEIVGTIRNVDFNDKTLGLQFEDITDEEFDTIAFYIDGFADKVEEEAA